ncbi:MarR family winged helix-turn-helix transcriptional regulator [Paenibacillus glycanilyticus]|uniref:MarR family winged helix-turn-helix transcriptional regulator n=1 Tax=Paenibacillus glycanilyticus TaxID=126569 RepID=UPI00204152AE|nr:MarR family winged helix-turn-helix transcriptional regulator [Paenibacillus glycanilyticus]MCM3629999.1 MarR family winged helix-turn-helix transcriptional regulator [Paenibacillus glycanilyticus]
MENVRNMFQILSRNFGLLSEQCCDSCCGQEVSLVQSHILYEINRQHNPSMQDIAGALGIDITTFSRQVKTLTDKGFVKKTPHPSDQRINILSLTPEGLTVENAINLTVNTQLNSVLSTMSEFERETVLRSIQLFNDAMTKSAACCVPPK